MPVLVSSPIVAAAGGSFLLEARTPAEIFTPEDLNEEQRQIASTAAQFARDEVLPAADAIEAKQPGALRSKLGSPPSTSPKSTAASAWTRSRPP